MSQTGSIARDQQGVVTLTGDTGSATGSVITLTGGVTGLQFTGSGSTLTLIDGGGTSVVSSLSGNVGTASPVDGNIPIIGSGNITSLGDGTELVFSLSNLVDHAVLVGHGTSTLTNVGPNGIAGIPLISNGLLADPSFGVAVVPGGGTGAVTFTANSLLIGNGAAALTALGAATNGQLPIGSTGASPVLAVITPGTNVTVNNGSGSITVNSSMAINGDTGSATGSTITFNGPSISTASQGLTFQASGSTVGLSLLKVGLPDTVDDNTGVFQFYSGGQLQRFMHKFASSTNAFLGLLSGNYTLTGTKLTGIGYQALKSVTNDADTTACGYNALSAVAGSLNNSAFGSLSLSSLTGGIGRNCSIGSSALTSLLTGIYNIALGDHAGDAYTGAESSNILFGSTGTIGDANTIRIGNQGSSNGQQNKCFVAGVNGATITTPAYVTIDTSTNQLSTTPVNQLFNYTNVNTSPYVVLSTDYYLSVDCSGGAITIQLPNTTTSKRSYIIKDRTGSAATNNITYTTVGGATLIDGATTGVISNGYGAVNIVGNATTYEVF